MKGRGYIDLTAYVIGNVRRSDELDYLRVVRRDPCGFCGALTAELDHIVPRSVGGSDAWDNRSGLCCSCNNRKQNDSLLGALARRQIRIELERYEDLRREYVTWGLGHTLPHVDRWA